MKIRYFLATLSIIILAGCSGGVAQHWSQEQVCPTERLEGDEAIKAMRKNLEALAETHPDSKLKAGIFYKNGPITIKEFLDLYEEYDFELTTDEPDFFGQSSSVGIVYPMDSDGILGEKITENLLTTEGIEKWFNTDSNWPFDEVVDAEKMGTVGFFSYSTPGNLLKLWNERSDIIRGVGVGCTRNFTYIRSSEAVSTGSGPSIFN